MKNLFSPLSKYPITQRDFNLKNTLINGQAFNWTCLDPPNYKEFRGVFNRSVVEFKVNEKDEVLYRCFPDSKEVHKQLSDYLQLNVDLQKLCSSWKDKDPHFAKVSDRLQGVRLLRQDPWECTVSFLCSQNNNIPRITQILKSIREEYGDKIVLDDSKSTVFYTFPTLEQLKEASEEDFKAIGLGYRAKYLKSTVELLIAKGGVSYLEGLKGKAEARESLLEFMGIGNKVADCIALFSLDQKNLIPVDTHVFQIYNKVYHPSKKTKELKLNKELYNTVQEFFQDLFGENAGWAQQIIFAADLPSFQEEIQNNSTQANKKTTTPTEESEDLLVKKASKRLAKSK